MMNRRSFLGATASFALGHLLTGCQGQNRAALTIRLLNGSIPPQVLGAFRHYLRQSGKQATLTFSPELQIAQIFSLLQSWKQQSSQPPTPANPWLDWVPFVGKTQSSDIPDLVTLGDYWLGKAIQQGLIQPLNPTQLEGWKNLPPQPSWQNLVIRNQQGQPDAKGRVWAAPYRWGSTVIAYRQDIFKQKGLPPPTDWSDLWRSDLRQQISLLDQPREVIGLTLKKLGQSYNTPDLKAVAALQPELDRLQPQVKLYSSDAYLQPLLLGDTWLAVGWSTDVLPLVQRNQTIAAVIPKSGTALWADLWVRPARNMTEVPSLVNDWISFCWQPETAKQLSLLSQATSPMLLTQNPATLPSKLRSNPLLVPNATTLQASEFLYPLSEATAKAYLEHWHRLRQVS